MLEINELKNTIDKLKNCENCKHSVWSLISDQIECFHSDRKLRNLCTDKFEHWELFSND